MSKPSLFSKSFAWRDPTAPGPHDFHALLDASFAGTDRNLDEMEVVALAHAVEHELALYESRGSIAGPICLEVRGESPEQEASLVSRIPKWVEADGLAIQSCTAKVGLLVQDETILQAILESPDWPKDQFLLVTGSGIPRLHTRRLVHRIAHECDVTFYYLADWDTWAFYNYAVWLRGAILPNESCTYAAVSNLRYLGLLSDDWPRIEAANTPTRPSREIWTARIAALREYDCFRDGHWQRELAAFETHGRGVNVLDLMSAMGRDEFVRFVVAKLTAGIGSGLS